MVEGINEARVGVNWREASEGIGLMGRYSVLPDIFFPDIQPGVPCLLLPKGCIGFGRNELSREPRCSLYNTVRVSS